MSPRNGRSRPPMDRPANNLDVKERNPTARAYAGPPCPGRGLWAVTVLNCPHCSTMHQHRVGDADELLSGHAFRTCPTTGRLYRLTPVQRRREAVRRAS